MTIAKGYLVSGRMRSAPLQRRVATPVRVGITEADRPPTQRSEDGVLRGSGIGCKGRLTRRSL